jgi:exopolysaccharide biosynthesis protein
MKFIKILAPIAFLVWFGNFILSNRSKPKQVLADKVVVTNSSPTLPVYASISSDNFTYSYLLVKGLTADKLALSDNTQSKKSGWQLMQEGSCETGVNGGFYGTDDKPVGWMVINGETVSKAKSSDLLNGFVAVKDSRFMIDDLRIETDVDFGLQTGPVLVSEGKPRKLNLVRDKPARRMVMGTAKDRIFILAIFNSAAETAGPNLVDLPVIVSKIGAKEGLLIDSAVNLDGGSASAIYTPSGHLEETSPVGSWWCINK